VGAVELRLQLHDRQLAEEIISIADGKLPIAGTPEAPDSAVRVSRDTSRVKAHIWKAGRMAPRKWGELVNEQANVAAPPKAVIIVEGSGATATWAAT
jgi:hypothetical protein